MIAETIDRGDAEGTIRTVVFAVEPYSYAEALRETVSRLRPHLDVLAVASRAHLEATALPAASLVFCGDPRPENCRADVRWAQFRPHEEPDVIRMDGVAESFPGLGLEALLGLVDRACAGDPAGQTG